MPLARIGNVNEIPFPCQSAKAEAKDDRHAKCQERGPEKTCHFFSHARLSEIFLCSSWSSPPLRLGLRACALRLSDKGLTQGPDFPAIASLYPAAPGWERIERAPNVRGERKSCAIQHQHCPAPMQEQDHERRTQRFPHGGA
ncbi:hypothetical protein CEV34_3185 [Brucella pseudogrignonensis]|uniref:Uncharacterized protein n=1 Tax=Brucella pseudogrignonensis TaxID=419475 RepID=A0A256GAE7_9HYPH|nr:hypothetical protein CEV34_3185 [Brucella pseudogrignonensis]